VAAGVIGLGPKAEGLRGLRVVAMALALASTASGQSRPATFVVTDSVSARPLERAAVAAVGGQPSFTSAAGVAQFDASGLKGGSVIVKKLGFVPETLAASRVTDTVRIAMHRLAQLPMVAIVGANGRTDFSGFESRCTAVYAECFGVEEIKIYPARRLSDFLVKAAGAQRTCDAVRGLSDCTILLPSTIGERRCVPTYFIDGMQFKPAPAAAMRGTTNVLSDIEKFANPSSVKGIEIYRAGQTIPPRFEAGNGCGSIVIWTR
jgi:hypothetical protein